MAVTSMIRQRNPISEKTRDEMKKKLKVERDKDRQMVKGVFKDYEVPGGMVEFVFKKYAEDPLEKYELHDNKVYTIPLGVAKHINGNTWYPVHKYTKNEDGTASQIIGQKTRRMGFQSLEFMDYEDSFGDDISRIVTVQNV
jgi:hypothetical protein